MEISDKAHIHWACRRGMRELDVLLMPFFEQQYDTLSDEDQQLFICLLKNDDPDLFSWLMNRSEPADARLQRIINLIQRWNQQRGSVAI
ncbi:FAD assembly factor SdhE [Enterobacteriaceae bacterium ESL0689]|nr:FAD assembly factor SdhE [Enterobacteriaceae bacterium ESL0689]